jgi:beta-lactam-binding protein with PASTA domain
MTLPAATAEINGDGYVVGDVTFQAADAQPPGGLIIGSAHAQVEPTVVDQKPDGGTTRPKGDSVDLVLSGPLPVSEPSSLALFILGLALLAMLLWVRRPRT